MVGDSILFDADMPHAYVAIGAEPAVLIMSNTVPPNASEEMNEVRTAVVPKGQSGVTTPLR